MNVLLPSALAVAAIHTAVGIDHTLPFIVIARAQQWTWRKTTWITLLCGLGHVLSSLVLGFLGIAFGLGVESLLHIETKRGTLAGWLLIGFGFAYTVWAVYQLIRKKTHTHLHVHLDGTVHEHPHQHIREHLHPHELDTRRVVTVWTLFIIFVFGPCEPMIPFIMAAYERGGWLSVTTVSLGFTAVTLSTMILLVSIGFYGLQPLVMKRLERYNHLAAGLVILGSGLAVRFLGL